MHYTTRELGRMSLVALDALTEVVSARLEAIEEANRRAEAEARKRRT